MNYSFQKKSTLAKGISIYLIVSFFFLPLWQVVSAYSGMNDFPTELSDNLNPEEEDTSNNNVSEEEQICENIESFYIKKSFKQIIIHNAEKHNKVLIDVLTPPPKS
jgi:hypothetical protein